MGVDAIPQTRKIYVRKEKKPAVYRVTMIIQHNCVTFCQK